MQKAACASLPSQLSSNLVPAFPRRGDYRAILIAGPTASGKSGAALRIAERVHGTIINADSMQVYRELRVLTARPSSEEERRMPHLLYGHVPAAEAYSVGRWLSDVTHAIREQSEAGRPPILVGGTGLYFRALTEGLAPVPDIPPETREHWRAEAARVGREELYALLLERDHAMAERLKAADPQRVVRALEVIDATGISLAEWQGENAAPVLSVGEVLKLYLAPEREPLYATIDARFDRMLEEGALDEVRRLADRKLDPGLPAMRAHGVPHLIAHLAGKIGLEEAAVRAKADIRHYAKRQMTWARRFMGDWEWVPDPDTAVASALAVLRP
jgi:tRNA dimethylallyltransferase